LAQAKKKKTKKQDLFKIIEKRKGLGGSRLSGKAPAGKHKALNCQKKSK
jgi:hypothetical protein